MSNVPQHVRLGTRGSTLARWQADYVRELLQRAWPELHIVVQVLATHGDRLLDVPLPLIGGKGVFTAELEAALRARGIDFAVHSLKDLPTEESPGLALGAILARADPRDVLISKARYTLETLPKGAAVGTGSRRRSAQLLRLRPDLRVLDLRGNVDTRIRKALDPEGPYDAVVLALAGVERLGRQQVITEMLPLETLLPAPGQGALAVQCRDEREALTLLAPLADADTELAVTAERAFLAGLGGGCATPVAAYASIEGGRLRLRGRVTAPDGGQQVDTQLEGAATMEAARDLGRQLAQSTREQSTGWLLTALT
jgi:hydroxymethylbilane synthase